MGRPRIIGARWRELPYTPRKCGPGTPYFADAPDILQQALLTAFDFEKGGGRRNRDSGSRSRHADAVASTLARRCRRARACVRSDGRTGSVAERRHSRQGLATRPGNVEVVEGGTDMEVVRLAGCFVLAALSASAADFSLGIGGPSAAMAPGDGRQRWRSRKHSPRAVSWRFARRTARNLRRFKSVGLPKASWMERGVRFRCGWPRERCPARTSCHGTGRRVIGWSV